MCAELAGLRAWDCLVSAHKDGVASMKESGSGTGFEALKTLIADLRKGLIRPVYAFVGEKYFTDRAARKLIDAVVPPAERTWNLERYEGQNVSWQQLWNSLKTPGFGASPKVVWLKDTNIFAGRAESRELVDEVLRDWSNGRRTEAASKLLELLGKAGLEPTKFEASLESSVAADVQVEIFGRQLDGAECREIRNILQFTLDRKSAVASTPDPVDGLMQILSEGLPPRVILLLTTVAADQRGRLWRKIREVGVALQFTVSRERNQALGRDAAAGVVAQIMREHGKRIAPKALDLLVQRAGVDVERLASEVEKLCLWVGDRAEVQPKDVANATADLAESWIFEFTGALSRRDLPTSLRTLYDLLKRGEQPLRLVALIARELRNLLLARECLEFDLAELRSGPKGSATEVVRAAKGSGPGPIGGDDPARSLGRYMSDYGTFSKAVMPRIPAEQLEAFGKAHPFVLFKRFQEALLWGVQDLQKALTELALLEQQLKTSRADARMLLEGFLLRWCSAAKAAVARHRLA